MTEPYCVLAEDGRHAYFIHECTKVEKNWQRRGSLVGEREVAWLQESANRIMLPLGPWNLVEIEPLTIMPSILCSLCGTHGFFLEGHWVPA